MTPEASAREKIDHKLAQAGWLVQDFKKINLSAALGVAVREHPTDTGPADYVLFVKRIAVGVIEAKRDEDGDNITAHERQTERYANAILSDFRNEFNPRIVVTVDMIATGTDVKPLEVLLFMRDVRSKGYYEQMKGCGVRSLGFDALKKVSNSADSAKARFVLIDAVGVEKSLKTESRPLEKKPGMALKDLLQGVAMGHRDDDTVLSLANRLVRLAKQFDDKARKRIEKASGGSTVGELGKGLVVALDADKIVQQALTTARSQGITRSEDTVG